VPYETIKRVHDARFGSLSTTFDCTGECWIVEKYFPK
jgi:hypothetical protein